MLFVAMFALLPSKEINSRTEKDRKAGKVFCSFQNPTIALSCRGSVVLETEICGRNCGSPVGLSRLYEDNSSGITGFTAHVPATCHFGNASIKGHMKRMITKYALRKNVLSNF